MFNRGYDHSPGCTCPACLKVRGTDIGRRREGSLGGRLLGVFVVIAVLVVVVVIANLLLAR